MARKRKQISRVSLGFVIVKKVPFGEAFINEAEPTIYPSENLAWSLLKRIPKGSRQQYTVVEVISTRTLVSPKED